MNVFTLIASRPQNYYKNRKRIVVFGKLTLDGNSGSAPAQIPASLFGLQFLEETSPLIKTDDTAIIDAARSHDASSLLTRGAGTNAPTNAPAGDYMITVRGQ